MTEVADTSKTNAEYDIVKLIIPSLFLDVLERLCQMRRLDIFTPSQIRDGVREFDASRAMIGTRRQIELCHAQHDVAARIKL